MVQLGGWLALGIAVLATGWASGVRLNLTGSLPVGAYVIAQWAPNRAVVRRGAVVLACLPPPVAAFARDRGYVPHGGRCPGGLVPVGKVVCGVPGDTVVVSGTGLSVNGQPVPGSRSLARDGRGRSMPTLASGQYVVPPGTMWLLAPTPRSFDSRYYGPVPLDAAGDQVVPLWTGVLLSRTCQRSPQDQASVH